MVVTQGEALACGRGEEVRMTQKQERDTSDVPTTMTPACAAFKTSRWEFVMTRLQDSDFVRPSETDIMLRHGTTEITEVFFLGDDLLCVDVSDPHVGMNAKYFIYDGKLESSMSLNMTPTDAIDLAESIEYINNDIIPACELADRLIRQEIERIGKDEWLKTWPDSDWEDLVHGKPKPAIPTVISHS